LQVLYHTNTRFVCDLQKNRARFFCGVSVYQRPAGWGFAHLPAFCPNPPALNQKRVNILKAAGSAAALLFAKTHTGYFCFLTSTLAIFS
jgi:hypothetical protein